MTNKSAREILSENLQSALKRSGMDQKDLAMKIGVSPASITNWLKGTKYPRIDKIQALADALNVRQSELTTDKDAKNEIKNNIETLAAHIDGDVTDEEMKEILAFIKGIKASKK